MDRDAIDELLDSIIGTAEPAYEDIGILDVPEIRDDTEAVTLILATLPAVHGRRVRAAP